MKCPSKKLLALFVAAFVFIGSSSGAYACKCKPDIMKNKVQIPSISTVQTIAHHPRPTFHTGSGTSMNTATTIRISPTSSSWYPQTDGAASAILEGPSFSQQNNTGIPSVAGSCNSHPPTSWQAWIPTLERIVTSVVRIVIIVLGVLNININLRVQDVHGGRRGGLVRHRWLA